MERILLLLGIKFEGEYLNGKRNGKGKEYDYDEKLIFEVNMLIIKNIKEKVILIINQNLKVNINMKKNGMGKDMIKKEI